MPDWKLAKKAPPAFLPLSAATTRLAKGMWAGWKAPAAVRDAAAASIEPPARCRVGTNPQDGTAEQNLTDKLKRFRAGYVPRRARAAKRLWAAALKGEIPIYVVPDACESKPPQPELKSPESDACEPEPPPARPEWPETPVQIPVAVLKRLFVPLKTLPDHAIRATLKAIGDPKLYVMLLSGRLVVQRGEFERWYVADRRKGEWPSQTAQHTGKHRGRPTKQSERLKAAIITLVEQKRWDRSRPFTKLAVLLEEEGQVAVPSVDTLRRLIRRIAAEDGDTRLHRSIRAKRVRSKKLTAK
jgi:hypothetical protein